MKTGVTKKQFIESLEAVLKLTRLDIEKLVLDRDGLYVNICYKDGYKKSVCIEGDSGIAIISDVVKGILK